MPIPPYEYPIEQCDVPEVRRGSLNEYRQFRRKCLEYLRGDADTSVMNQVHGLAWHTAVFRTLNEARRMEQDHPVNGAMWELLTTGYANIMALGIRKLVDKHPDTDSVWNVISQIERRPELLRRENFVCYDGLPFDTAAAFQKHISAPDFAPGQTRWLSTRGPDAWGMSQMLHKSFDALAGYPEKRRKLDQVQPAIIATLKARLSHESIQDVCTMADKVMAHAERIAEGSDAVPTVTYDMIDTALENVVRVANFLSANFFNDTVFGSVVPVPQYNVLEALDQPWVKTENLPALHEQWHAITERMDQWAYNTEAGFLPSKSDLQPGA